MSHDGSERMGQRRRWVGWAVFFAIMVVVFLLGLVVASLMERRREAVMQPMVLVPIAESERADSDAWGVNFPLEYDRWRMTADTGGATKWGGPTKFSWIERDRNLKTLFAGYAFSVEYNDDRGHMWSVIDVKGSARVDPARGGKKMPGTCMTCKSSQVPVLMEKMGAAKFYSTPFDEIKKTVEQPIGCYDCHDPKTMKLRISRPALREALLSMGRDQDKLDHRQMRNLVCAQCHVEYYFKDKTYLTFPWKHGTSVEAMLKYYEENDFADWVHPLSKTRMIKAQHPDYEIYSTGIHAYRGVACVDCHMPYRTEGGVKFTDHKIQSPLKNIANSCAVCHRWSEQEVRRRVEEIQDKNWEMLQRAGKALVAAHREVAEAMKRGVSDEKLEEARKLIREAQFRWDYVAANNGMGFHSPQECARILASAIDLGQQARISVARLGRKSSGE